MNEILTVNVILEEELRVEGARQSICMISFSGTAEGPYFYGMIQKHGVDTQKITGGKLTVLSARYMLEGTDDTGSPCRMFIENNGTEYADGILRTRPMIVTDSRSLSWMEDAALEGTVEGSPDGVRIHIYRKD